MLRAREVRELARAADDAMSPSWRDGSRRERAPILADADDFDELAVDEDEADCCCSFCDVLKAAACALQLVAALLLTVHLRSCTTDHLSSQRRCSDRHLRR